MKELLPACSLSLGLWLIAMHKGAGHKEHQSKDDSHKEASDSSYRIIHAKEAVACADQSSHDQDRYNDGIDAYELVEHSLRQRNFIIL